MKFEDILNGVNDSLSYNPHAALSKLSGGLNAVTLKMLEQAGKLLPPTIKAVEAVEEKLKSIHDRVSKAKDSLAAMGDVETEVAGLVKAYGECVASGESGEAIKARIADIKSKEEQGRVQKTLLQSEITALQDKIPQLELELARLRHHRDNAQALIDAINICLISQEYNKKAAELAKIVLRLRQERSRLKLWEGAYPTPCYIGLHTWGGALSYIPILGFQGNIGGVPPRERDFLEGRYFRPNEGLLYPGRHHDD